MRQFYTYIYRDKGVPFYVGKGIGSRAFKHLKLKGTHFTNRIQKLIANGTQPDIEIINALDEDHAKFLEMCLIAVIGRADLGLGPLLNLTDGGDGRSTWSEQQKTDHSTKITGQTRSVETCKLMASSAVERCKRIPMIGNRGGGRKKGSITSVEHAKKLSEAARAAHARKKNGS